MYILNSLNRNDRLLTGIGIKVFLIKVVYAVPEWFVISAFEFEIKSCCSMFALYPISVSNYVHVGACFLSTTAL